MLDVQYTSHNDVFNGWEKPGLIKTSTCFSHVFEECLSITAHNLGKLVIIILIKVLQSYVSSLLLEYIFAALLYNLAKQYLTKNVFLNIHFESIKKILFNMTE